MTLRHSNYDFNAQRKACGISSISHYGQALVKTITVIRMGDEILINGQDNGYSHFPCPNRGSMGHLDNACPERNAANNREYSRDRVGEQTDDEQKITTMMEI